MLKMRSISGALLSLVCCACIASAPRGEALPIMQGELDPRIHKLMGSQSELYMAPDSIQAYLVSSEPARRGDRLETFPVLQRGPLLTAEQAGRLQRMMINPQSYNFNSVKKCPFLPRLGLVFYKGDERAHILVCFSCNEWSFGSGDRGAIEDMDSVRPELLRLARELFPDDQVFRSLEAAR
ncbi:MAG: hypothetical protein K1X75_06430 [Leptospirales bacterium]|nr:hypothetical protein [Leptospirales bacterium]